MVDGRPMAWRVVLDGYSVMGFTVIGLGLYGISIVFLTPLGQDKTEAEARMAALNPPDAFGFSALARLSSLAISPCSRNFIFLL